MPVRPVILVHGAGNQKKGEHLSATVEPWVQFLRKHLGPDSVAVEVDLRPEDGPAHAPVQFEDETWEIWEAYWAESFHPLRRFQVLSWAFVILRDHASSIVQGLVPLLRKRRYPESADPIYRRRPRSRGARAYDWLVGTVAIGIILYSVWQVFRLWIVDPTLSKKYRISRQD